MAFWSLVVDTAFHLSQLFFVLILAHLHMSCVALLVAHRHSLSTTIHTFYMKKKDFENENLAASEEYVCIESFEKFERG